MQHLLGTDRNEAARTNQLFTAMLFAFLYLPFVYVYGYQFRTIDFVDFPSFYWGAQFAFIQHISPYGRDVFLLQEVTTGDVIFPYLYPPPSLVLFYPFLLFGYKTASLIMLAFNHLVFVGLLYLLLYRVVDGVRAAPAVFIFFLAYLLLFQPMQINLDHGQINLMVLALVLVSWTGLREERGGAFVGVPLALAILLKTYPALFLPLLLFRRRYDAAAWTVGIIALISLAALVLVPATAWHDWFVRVLPSGGYGVTPLGLFSPANPHDQSLNGFLQRLFVPNPFTMTLWPNPPLARILGYVCAAVIGGTTLLLSYRARQNSQALDLEVPLYLLAMFLLAPLSWNHHAVYALPAAMVVMLRLWRRGQIRVLALLALPCAMVLAWTMPLRFARLSGVPELIVLSVKLYAVIGFWVLTAGLLYIEGRKRAVEADDYADQPTVVPMKRVSGG